MAQTPEKTPAKTPEKAAKKVSWRDKAAHLLTARLTGSKPLDAKQLKAQAEKRGALLTAQLGAARKGTTLRPPGRILDMEYELKCILNGTWTPGMSRPKNKEVTAAMSSMTLLGPSPTEQAEADKVDAIITGE